jgi:hypothetical protein
MRSLIHGRVSAWERRRELLTMAIPGWSVGNPLVLYTTLLSDQEDAIIQGFGSDLDLLVKLRFSGSDRLLVVVDQALRDSVLLAPR